MSEFTDIRARLSGQRGQRDETRRRLDETRERLRNVRFELETLRRAADPDDQQRAARIAQLEAREAELAQALAAVRSDLAGFDQSALGLLTELTLLADPAEQVEELNDAFPILFFPLRIETRFKTLGAGPQAKSQLWVRVYPDDCQVDTFEEMLSDSEVKSARLFWAGVWKAGLVEDQERGAWKTFVGSHGSGRAAWILRHYEPLGLDTRPAKTNPEDIILVVVPEMELTPGQEADACDFWVKFWKADGDPFLRQQARQELEGEVGAALAAEIVEKFRPVNLGDNPPGPHTRAGVAATCVKIVFDPNQPGVTKTTSWTRAPKARAMPDRLVLMCFQGNAEAHRIVGHPIPDQLATGPDPSLPEDEQLKMLGDELEVNEELKWMVDFERAVSVGMGFKVDLNVDESVVGFDRLLVLGVRTSADEAEGRALLESLITNHHHGRHGFGLVPQGSPTNNTEGEGAAFSWVEDPDATFDTVFKQRAAFEDSDDAFERRDGQWLATHLGIDPEVVRLVAHADGRDQGEARAMNTALWPATLGYMMEEMMTPLFSFETTDATRRFFSSYVTGRGPVPAVRVGRQPYGILPAMAFSRYAPKRLIKDEEPRPPIFLGPALAADPSYIARLYVVLSKMDADWGAMAQGVAHVGAPAGNPHQTLLDIVGLHSGSVEFHQRYAESLQHIFNQLLIEYGPLVAITIAMWLGQRGAQILQHFGISPPPDMPILEKFFFSEGTLLTGPVVDDVPLSEVAPVRDYSADGQNYLEWLATSSTEKIRLQDFGGNPAPTALLYLMLRHAVLLGQWDAGLRLLAAHQLVNPAVMRAEPAFINVAAKDDDVNAVAGSKFEPLYRAVPSITGNNQTTIAEHILTPSFLADAFETRDLREIIRALQFLRETPTARLERVFSEHLDCCSYRLDAWKTGLAALRLEEMRTPAPPSPTAPAPNAPTKGLYLGAYGWLEHVVPENKVLKPVPPLPGELGEVFQKPGQPTLVTDSTNAGYIHAPSLDHATTAAVLKNAYVVNASTAHPEAMSVNLSSERVRRALSLLEGVRNGQSLSALLGYQFERGLHDRHGLAEVDKFIYPLRQVFPLVANKLRETQDGTADVKLLEARNVVDGLRLINHLRTVNNTSYPFGLPTAASPGPGQLRTASPAESDAINAEVRAVLDLHDAAADLILSESIYQTVRGNFDRAAANTQALGRAHYPPETEVVITPRRGQTLTHRLALHLDAAADDAAPDLTPRARAEAALNAWLAARLPAPADVVCAVSVASPALAAPEPAVVSQADLDLQPIDLLYLLNLDLEQAMAELDARVVQFVRYQTTAGSHPAVKVTINYTEHVDGQVSFFELAPLLKSLRALLLGSRHLSPADMALPVEAEAADYLYDFADLEGRVDNAINGSDGLDARRAALVALETDASPLDDYAQLVSDEFLLTALHGVPQTGTADIHDSIRAVYDAVLAKLVELIGRWDDKAADFDALMLTLPGLTTDEERLALLVKAEGLIASSTTVPTPADPAVYQADVEALKDAFDNTLSDFKDLLTFDTDLLADFVTAADAVAPAAAVHDAVPFDINAQKDAVTSLRADLAARVTSLREDVEQRIAKANALVAESAAVTDVEGRLRVLQQAAAQVLGDEARLLPRFTLPAEQATELQNCFADSAALLDHLKSARGRLFPEDDWLYGLARVRDKLRAWETVVFLSEAFEQTAPALTPLQLPHRAGDSWLALEFPDDYLFDGDRLLYTPHFAAAPFVAGAPQTGLLLDEWNEVIPGKDEVTGLAFHFDRPNSEPPQAMLLAVPPQLRGKWVWDDLVAMLHDTLDAARKRAVEPSQVDASNYAQFLPATLTAVTLYQMTIAVNLAANNGLYNLIGGE
jgi:hypothetical protein